MNTESRIIKLYRTRTFSEKMSDTFDFVRENWRVLLKYITYLLLPIAVVETFLMTNFMSGYMESFMNIGSDLDKAVSWMSSMLLYVLMMYVDIILVRALVYSMMQKYEQRPGLQGITFAELKPGMMRMIGRQLILMVIDIVLLVILGLFVVMMMLIHPAMFFPAGLLVMLFLPLIVLADPIFLFEERGIVRSYGKSIRLGWKTWAGIVCVVFVLYFTMAILQGVISMPYYLMVTLKDLLSGKNATGFVSSFGYTAIQYLFGIISSFSGSVLTALIVIGIAYQYGHACDKVDGVTVDRDIENFEAFSAE